jgi:hypothetical protein
MHYILSYFSYFEKIIVGLCDHHAVCVSACFCICASLYLLWNG